MIFVRQGYVTIILVTLTIIFQSAGMAALIQWIKAQFPNGIHRLGVFRSFILVVRFTSLLVCLHLFEILLWASFYRWKCFSSWGGFLFFGGRLCHRWGGRSFSETNVAGDGAGRKCYRCAHVRALRELPVCHCDSAHSTRGSRTNPPARCCSHLRKQPN
jgi:hypothetical protein